VNHSYITLNILNLQPFRKVKKSSKSRKNSTKAYQPKLVYSKLEYLICDSIKTQTQTKFIKISNSSAMLPPITGYKIKKKI